MIAAPVVHEPFDYATGNLNGLNGGTGFDGAWSTDGTVQVAEPGILYGTLETSGNKMGDLTASQNRYIGKRGVSTGLTGLLDDGDELWFSVIVGYDGGNATNTTLAIALATDQFTGGNYSYQIAGLAGENGLGVFMGRLDGQNYKVAAAQYRDSTTYGSGFAGIVYGATASTDLDTAPQLVVGKFTWGATEDTLDLYLPDSDLNLGAVVSSVTVNVDQTQYDTITAERGDKVVMDEIRFGATYADVAPADSTPPSVVSRTPDDEDTDVLLTSDLSITFDENVSLGTGNITLVQTGVGNFEVFDVATSPNITVTDATITIDPTALFNLNTGYHVLIDSTAIEDVAGNAFAGYSLDTEWNFTSSADGDPPVIDTLSPADDSIDVPFTDSLVIDFTDVNSIVIGEGDIEIRETGTDTLIQTIASGDSEVTITGPTQATVSASLPISTAVYVLIDAGFFADANGNAFAGIADPTTWNFTVETPPPPAPGDITIYTHSTAGESLASGASLTQGFDSGVRTSSSHILSGTTDFQLASGHHLVMYNTRFDDSSGGGARSEFQSNLNLAGADIAAGWSSGYIRRQSNQFETLITGGAIIDVASDDDVLQLITQRTDNTGEGAVRVADSSGIQFIKLDDTWDYLRLAGHDGLGADQVLPVDNTSWTPVTYTQEDEVDAGSFTHSGAPDQDDIILEQAGHYLVLANTYCYQTSGDRTAIKQRLTLDGAPISGSSTTAYIRGGGQDSCEEAAASIGMIIETTSIDQVLNVEIQLDTAVGISIDGDRTALTIVKLPDTADFVRLEDLSGDQDINPASLAALSYDDVGTTQLELDSAFSHDTGVNPSQVTVNNTGDYLFLAAQYDSDDEFQRGNYNMGWQVNGTGGLTAYGQTGSYGRDLSGTDAYGNWSGFLAGLNSTDYIETLTVQLGETGTNNPEVLSLQGVDLTSLFNGGGGGGNNYSDWIATYPGVGGLTGFGDDPDGDGNENGVENYLGTAPDVASAGIVAGVFDSGAGTFTFTHPLNETPADDITAAYRWSKDLATFTDDGQAFEGTTVTFNQGVPSGGEVTVTATITGTPLDKLFVEILVTQNP